MPKFFIIEEGLLLGGSSLVVSLVSGLKLLVLYLDNRYHSQFPAGLFAIFLCFLVIMMRRRRQRQRMTSITTQGGIPPNIQLGNKPMFNRPWGQATASPNQVPMSAYDSQGQNYNPYNNAAQYPSNSDYPNQSPLPPPPAYGQDVNNHGYYAAVRTFSITLADVLVLKVGQSSGHPPQAQGRNSEQPYSPVCKPSYHNLCHN